MKTDMPKKPGYYWAKWRIATDDTPEGDELTPCDDWEIVQINDNGGVPGTLEEFSVSVPGVAVVQWRDQFFWGSFVAPLKDPTMTTNFSAGFREAARLIDLDARSAEQQNLTLKPSYLSDLAGTFRNRAAVTP